MPLRSLVLAAMAFLVAVASAQSHGGTSLGRDIPFVPPKRWAMVVGAGNYAEYGKLTYAAKDAKIFAKTLIESFHFQPDTVELITDDGDSDRKPDAATIKAALDRQIGDKRLNKGDLFIFYFAGHGLGTSHGDLLLPTDANKQNAEKVGQPVKEIVDMFVKAGLRNVLIIADACRAGEKNEFGQELQELGRKANIAVMLGCAPGARSYEYPQLGHGVFTSFLIKTLKSRDLRNPLSGALWASSVIEEVSNKVRDYTIRDYPTSPQTPMGWSEKTQDVLLAAYPTTSAVKSFIDQAGQLQKDKYSSAVVEMASALIDEKRNTDAIELLKTLDGVEQLSPQVLFLFGYALGDTGRMSEASRIFTRLSHEGGPFFGNLATISNPSRDVLADQKVKACLDLWKVDKSYNVAMLIWQTIRFKADLQAQVRFLSEASTEAQFEPWQRLTLQGELASLKGDWNGALDSFKKALSECADPDSRRMLAWTLVPTLANDGRIAESDPIFKELAEGDYRDAVLICRAGIAKRQHRSDLVPGLLNQALDSDPDPSNILTCLLVGSDNLPAIAEKVKREAAKHPYAWQAHVARALIVLLVDGNQPEFAKAIQDAEKYCDDSLSVNARVSRVMMDVCSLRYQAGQMSDQNYLLLSNNVFVSLLPDVPKFVEDYETWQIFTFAALGTGRQDQLAKLMEKYLGKGIREGTLDRELRPFCILAFASVGRDDLVNKLISLGGIMPNDAADYGFTLALYRALKEPGVKPIPTLPDRNALSVELRPFYDALGLYLDLLAGKDVSKEVLGKADVTHPVSKTLIGLAYLQKGDPEKGIALLRESLERRALGYTFVEAFARRRLYLELVKAKKLSEANQILFEGLLVQFMNPIYHDLRFVGLPETASTGSWKYDVKIRLDSYSEEGLQYQLLGNVALSVDKQSLVSGDITLQDGTKAKITGTVDKDGNVTGQFKIFEDTYTLTGKLVPRTDKAGCPGLDDAGPIFEALDSDNRRLVILCRSPK